MKKVLEMAKPFVTGLPGYAILQSIILTEASGMNWFYESYIGFCCSMRMEGSIPKLEANFINLPLLRQYNNYEFLPQQIFCPLLRSYEYEPEYIYNTTTIIDFIKYYINQNKYVAVYLDRKYIPQHMSEESYAHITFIYGYDDGEGIVYLADYLSKFELFTLKMEDLRRAFESAVSIGKIPNHSYNIDGNYFANYHKTVVLHNSGDEYHFNIDTFKNNIMGYYHSSAPVIFNNHLFMKYFDDKWGLSSYDAFINFIDYRINNKIPAIMDTRQFHMLHEHKYSLRLKIEYLLVTYPKLDTVLEQILQIEKAMEIVKNLILKYNLTFQNELFSIINEMLIKTKMNEKSMLDKLLSLI